MRPAGNLLFGHAVRLDALEETDVPTVARWETGPFLRLYDARPAMPRSEAEVAEWLDDVRQSERTLAFAIRALEDDRLLGTLELDSILWTHRVCGMGLAIGERENWGRGFGSEAAALGLAFAFQELNLHRVTATVFAYNERSIALVEKLGFRREGAFREFLERDGQRYDMLLYGLLRHEWRAPTEDR